MDFPFLRFGDSTEPHTDVGTVRNGVVDKVSCLDESISQTFELVGVIELPAVRSEERYFAIIEPSYRPTEGFYISDESFLPVEIFGRGHDRRLSMSDDYPFTVFLTWQRRTAPLPRVYKT